MPRLFLIRHGEPEVTWGGGNPDPGLSAKGRGQAEAVAARVAGLGRLAMISSPMRRCRETAAPLATRLGASPAIEPRVSEVVAPPGTGDRRAWLRANFPWEDPKTLRSWSSLDPSVRLWRAAMLEAVHAIKNDTAIFTHFIAINAIAGAAMGLEHTIVCTPNYGSITEIEERGGKLHLISLDAGTGVGDVR